MNHELHDQPNKKREFLSTVFFAIIAIGAVLVIRMFIFQPFMVSGESMYPTLKNADYLIVDEASYRFNEPKRGDVIVFRYPENPKRFFVKRIIGLPGETVRFENNAVLIKNEENPDGIKLSEPYISQITIPGEKNEVVVSSDNYFVMGDNRGFSSDSRAWGQLPKENIIGVVGLRLFPLKTINYRPGSLQSFEK
jgi:signal peptidase I